MYKNIEFRKKIVRKFIRKNPKTTYREIKEKLHIKIEKLYKGSMTEAFKDAHVKSPRTFRKKTEEENRKIIIDFIRKNPKVGGQTISKKTGINVCNVFSSIQKAYKSAGITYPRRESYNRTAEEKRKEIINLIQKNPLITTNEIIEKSRALPHKLFGNLGEIYKLAGIEKVSGPNKRTLKIKNKIINFIKENPLSTQREINIACNTHIQDMFERGIFEAYELSNVKFPFERLKLYGVGLKETRERAKDFEKIVALELSKFGTVNRLIKSKRGIADIIFERGGAKVVVEVKDYRAKDISRGQIRQLNKYLEDFNCNIGFLICHKKPKKNKFLIGKNKIFVLEESELKKIPSMMRL